MKRFNSRSKLALCAPLSALAFAMLLPRATHARNGQAQEEERSHRSDVTFTVYAALDLGTVTPKGVLGNPGDTLVVSGNLFKSGDGMEGANAGNDPNADHSIGKIQCRATFIDADPTHSFATFVSELYSWPGEGVRRAPR